MTKNTYLSAKSAALAALSDAAAFDAELVTAVEKASSPKHTAQLRALCNKRLQLHGKVAASVRYLDQCANRPTVDPVRAAILRGDIEVIRAALFNEVFEVVDDVGDVELLRLLDAIWPVWCRKHNVDDAELPIGLPNTPEGKGLRVRPEWLPIVNPLWPSIVDELREDIDDTRRLAAKLRGLATYQTDGRVGMVRDAEGHTYYYRPGELEAEVAKVEQFLASAVARAAEAK